MTTERLPQALFRFALPALLALPSAALAQEARPVHYVLAVPAAMRSESGLACLKTAAEMLLKDAPGGVVHVYDATTAEPMADPITVPSGNQKFRLRTVATPIKAWNLAFRARFSEDAEKLNAIRLPQLADVVARLPRPCRLLLLGDWRYRDARDPGFVWQDGCFPSDDHIAARRRDSLYGCADRAQQLQDVQVYFCTLSNDRASDSYGQAGRQFWARFVHAQGGRLVFWGPSLENAFRAFREGSEALVEKDLRLEPKGVLAMVRDRAQKPVIVDTAPRVRFVVVTDGSVSSTDRLAIERATYPRLLHDLARWPGQSEAGVVVFRGRGSHDIAPVVELKMDAKGQPTPPLAGMERFIVSKDVEVRVANFAPGSEQGSVTGQMMKVSRMEPLGSSVDTAFGLRQGLAMLAGLQPTDVPVLVFCGDCDVSETVTGNAIDIENKQLLGEVTAFARANPNAQVLSLFTGRTSRDESFFRGVAAAAGTRGVFLNRADQFERTLRDVIQAAQQQAVRK